MVGLAGIPADATQVKARIADTGRDAYANNKSTSGRIGNREVRHDWRSNGPRIAERAHRISRSGRLMPARKRILVADDDADALAIMSATLESAGFQVETAMDGAEAIRRFREAAFDLVMLDVDMPTLNGYEVCVALRREAGELLPIVMVTGMNDVESVDTAYRSGATDFIGKPISWALIGHRVRYLLRGYQLVIDLKAAEERIRRLAYFDTLTGLPRSRAHVCRDVGISGRCRRERSRGRAGLAADCV